MDASRFVEHVAQHLHCDAERAAAAVRAVLPALRDRLTAKEAADVAAQLPGPLKQIWVESEAPGREVARMHVPQFLVRVREAGNMGSDLEAERAVKAVFLALQELLGSPSGKEGEAWDILSQLPKDLKLLWLEVGEYPKAGRRGMA